MITLEEDRRSHPRVALERPCKLYDPQTGKYRAGVTCDFSQGGFLVRLDQRLNSHPGDVLYIGIAQKRRQILLRSNDMVRARVTRIIGTPAGHWLIGLELLDHLAANTETLRKAA